MGSLMKLCWVGTPTTLATVFYMQISTAIIAKSVLFNTVESMHDNVTEIMSVMFSW